jgi:hypothetical protein
MRHQRRLQCGRQMSACPRYRRSGRCAAIVADRRSRLPELPPDDVLAAHAYRRLFAEIETARHGHDDRGAILLRNPLRIAADGSGMGGVSHDAIRGAELLRPFDGSDAACMQATEPKPCLESITKVAGRSWTMLAAVGSKFKGVVESRRTLFLPCRCHADYFILHGIFSAFKLF